jgi:hypothetical protein
MTKTYLLSIATATSLGFVGGLTGAGIGAADAKPQDACSVIEAQATAAQKTAVEQALAPGLRTNAEVEFGEGTFDAKQIKARGVTLRWEVVDGIEVLKAASHMCVAGTWAAGEPQ